MNSILRNILFGMILLALVGGTGGNCQAGQSCSCEQDRQTQDENRCRDLWAEWLESDYPQASMTSTTGFVVYPPDWDVKREASYRSFCDSYVNCCPAPVADAGSRDVGEYRPPVYYPDAAPCDPSRPYACGHDAE